MEFVIVHLVNTLFQIADMYNFEINVTQRPSQPNGFRWSLKCENLMNEEHYTID